MFLPQTHKPAPFFFLVGLRWHQCINPLICRYKFNLTKHQATSNITRSMCIGDCNAGTLRQDSCGLACTQWYGLGQLQVAGLFQEIVQPFSDNLQSLGLEITEVSTLPKLKNSRNEKETHLPSMLNLGDWQGGITRDPPGSCSEQLGKYLGVSEVAATANCFRVVLGGSLFLISTSRNKMYHDMRRS